MNQSFDQSTNKRSSPTLLLRQLLLHLHSLHLLLLLLCFKSHTAAIINQSVDRPTDRSMDRWIDGSMDQWSTGWSVSRLQSFLPSTGAVETAAARTRTSETINQFLQWQNSIPSACQSKPAAVDHSRTTEYYSNATVILWSSRAPGELPLQLQVLQVPTVVLVQSAVLSLLLFSS